MGSTPKGLSASRAAAILGVSKYKTPLQAWLEIMEERKPGFCEENGYLKPEKSDPWLEPRDSKKAPLRWGLAFEDAICDMVGGVVDREKEFAHPEHSFITCHIDGMQGERLQENKTAFEMAFKLGWGEPGSAMIPEDYQVQIQIQMLLAKKSWTDVNVLVFPRSQSGYEKLGWTIRDLDSCMIDMPDGNEISCQAFARNLDRIGYFHRYHCPANKDAQDQIVKQLLEFWNVNVEKEVPPPVKGYSDIKWLISSPEGELEADPFMKELWSEYCDIDEEIDSMVKRKEEIKNNFASWTAKKIREKAIIPGVEKGKLNIFAGARKLFSVSRPKPGTKVSRSTVETLKDDSPVLYEKMKKTSFLDIIGEIPLTEKQEEKRKDLEKFLGALKLTKLLSKDNVMKQIEKSLPELYKEFQSHGIIEKTEPVSRLSVAKPKKD